MLHIWAFLLGVIVFGIFSVVIIMMEKHKETLVYIVIFIISILAVYWTGMTILTDILHIDINS